MHLFPVAVPPEESLPGAGGIQGWGLVAIIAWVPSYQDELKKGPFLIGFQSALQKWKPMRTDFHENGDDRVKSGHCECFMMGFYTMQKSGKEMAEGNSSFNS